MAAPASTSFAPGGIDQQMPTYTDPYADCARGCFDTSQTVLVWPAHAATAFMIMVLLAGIVIYAWWHLRGDHCWKCGQETGLCQHTRYDEPKDPHGGVHL